MIENAPTPSASVDTPMSVVSRPQAMNKMPRKSTCWSTDSDANFDADGRRAARTQTKTKRRAVCDAGGHRDANRMIDQRVARAAAVDARLGPRFAAAAAVPAGGAHRHVDRNVEPGLRFVARHGHFRREHVELAVVLVGAARAEKIGAHTLDDAPDRRKVDRDLIRKAFVRYASPHFHDRFLR